MNIEIIEKMDKDYYLEYYYMWLKHRSKFKKYERILGLLLIILGIFWRNIVEISKISLASNSEFLNLHIPIFFLGVFTFYNFYHTKRKWLKNRMKDGLYDTEVKIIFTDDEMRTSSKLGNSSLKWESFRDIINTKKGIFFVLKNKTSIYVKKNSILNENDINKIISKIK